MKDLLKIDFEKFANIVIGSAVIGIAISYWDIYLFHILLSAFLLLTILRKKNNYQENKIFALKINKILYPFLLAFFWYLTTIMWSVNIIYSLKYFFYLFCGISLVVIIVKYNSSLFSFQNLFKILSYLVIIELIIGLLESFSSFQMPISRYSELLPFFGKTPQVLEASDILLSLNSSPPTGFHWDTNEFALSMMLAAPFFLCLDRVIIKSLGLASITIVIIMAASRAVFFGLLIIIALYLLLIKKKIKSLILALLSVVVVLYGMFFLSESDNPNLNEIANTINTGYLYLTGDLDVAGSLKWRRELVDNGINALIESKGLGVGAGGSVHIQEQLGGVDGRFTSMHNFWIELLVEGGLIFFILFICWIINIIIKLFSITISTHNQRIKYFSSSLFLSIVGFLPAAISSSSTIYFFPMWILFGLCLSIIKISHSDRFFLNT